MDSDFPSRPAALGARHESLVSVPNAVDSRWDNGVCERHVNPVVTDKRVHHTINEPTNGHGPAPVNTSEGWLHPARGVRNTAAGLRSAECVRRRPGHIRRNRALR